MTDVLLPMTARQLHDTVAIDPDVLDTLANAAYVQDAEITGSRYPWATLPEHRKERYRCIVLAIMAVARTKRKVKECTPRP